MNHEWTTSEAKLFKLARPYLQVMYNELHTKEVVRFAFTLLDTAGGDREIVIPAAILHDVGWSQVPKKVAKEARVPGGNPELIKIHEDKGAIIAVDILREVTEDIFKIEEIVNIIQGHDTRNHALSYNDKIVKDADKLSRYAKPFFMVLPKRLLGMSSRAVCESLELGLKKWFFLPHSKKIAEKELNDRMEEIDCIPSKSLSYSVVGKIIDG